VTREVVQPAAVRRKVESWLSEQDDAMAIALRARPEWSGDPVLTVGGVAARVVPCATPLAARAALRQRADRERLVLLTELTDNDLGDGLLAHFSRATVRSINAWDLVRQMFGVETLDPTIADSRFSGGRWIADALTEYAGTEGWPPPPGAVLTRDHVLRCLAGRLLDLDRDQLDSAGLLQWSTDPHDLMHFTTLPSALVAGITAFLADVAGPAAVPILAAVRAGHGVDALPLGLLAAALWPATNGSVTSGKAPGTEVTVARTRLEPLFGNTALTEPQVHAFRAAAEAWVDRAIDSDHRAEAHRMLARAEALAAQIGATDLLAGSDLLPAGFTQRLRDFAAAVRLATPHNGQPAGADAVAAAQRALATLGQHRAADPARLETARMAVRALRWLSTTDGPVPATLLDALHRQVREDAWVDRARLDLFAGDTDAQAAEAYALLHRAVDMRRTRHDQQFATQLAAATVAEAAPGAMLRVEEVLARVVRPIIDQGRRVLLLVLDGMSTAAATELTESLTRTGAWLELTPDGGPRTGVLAALPTITEVSRCSLLSGRIAVGQQKEERAAFGQLFPGAVLLHKAMLRAGAGAAVDPEVRAAMEDVFTPLVAAVINTIDDALDRSDPGTIVWGEENIAAVRDLIALAQDRIVVLVSDHGHVMDRGPDARTLPSPSSENRWRPATPAAGDGEVAVSGSRVAKGGGVVVLPWREEVRYGPRKAGYHGGAAPAEAVIPLIMLSASDEVAVPGWSGAPVASPDWWREPLPETQTPQATTAGRRSTKRQPQQDTALFDLTPEPEAVVSGPVPTQPALVQALLASDTYRQRRGTRAPLPDDRVAALVGMLLAGGGRATMDTLAAHAGIPAHRIDGTITALRKLLQVEGYPVVEIDADGQTVKLDTILLIEQFHLDQPA
jgi:hypothetical protein